MGKNVGLAVSYRLPMSSFELKVTERLVVSQTEAGTSYLEKVVDASVTPTVLADRQRRHTLSINAGVLEKIDLTISLDDRGFIRSINSESGRDLSPVMSLVGKVIAAAGTVAVLGVTAVRVDETSLEDKWAATHAELAAAATALQARVKDMLDLMCQQGASPAEVRERAHALEALQSQLATISQSRRTWISEQATTAASSTWNLRPSDLLKIDAVHPQLSSPQIPAGLREAADSGVLLAIVDPDRSTSPTPPPGDVSLVDEIVLRSSRPVSLAVYLLEDAENDLWRLDATSIRDQDIVDEFSRDHRLSLEGSFARTQSISLSYHPDMSVSSFGVKVGPTAASIATSLGEVVDAAAAARKAVAERPTAEEVQKDAAETRLALLKSANDYEILAATRERSVELAILEQEKKIRESSK